MHQNLAAFQAGARLGSGLGARLGSGLGARILIRNC